MNCFLSRRITLPVFAVATATLAPADFSHWICDDGIYSESSCWDDGIPSDPGEAGAIDFDNLGMPYTVNMDVDATFGTINITSPEARMSISGRAINPAFSFNVVPGAEVTMTSSSFVGGTGVYTNGGLLTTYRANLIDLAGFEQNNLLRIVAAGVGGNAELTVNTSFTNHGVMEFQGGCCAGNNAILTVPGSDLLTNTGGINLLAGPGIRRIDAHLDNQGVINLGQTSFFDKTDGLYTTSGTINFGESVVLNFDNGATLTQSAGLIDMPASSYIDIDTGGAFTFTGGTLNGQVRLTDADLLLAPASVGGAFEFRGVAGTLTGDVGADQSVTLFATGFSGMNATVTTTGDVTNAGLLATASGCCNGSNTRIIVPDGSVLTNTGLMDLQAAFGVQSIAGDFDNQGALTIARATVFDKVQGTYRNAGDISVALPGSISLRVAADFVQDDGTLMLQDTARMSLDPGSTFFFNGGDITGTGEVLLTDAHLVIDPNASGSGRFRFQRDANTLTGDIAPDQSILIWALGTSGQSGAVTTVGDVTNAGSITMDGACCNGTNVTLTVPPGSSLTNTGSMFLRGNAGIRFITADFDNLGLVEIDRLSRFNAPNGTYTNQGTLRIQPGNTLTVSGSTLLNTGPGIISGGGTLDVSGVDFVSEAAVAPGVAVGTLNLTGTYEQAGPGSLRIEVGGPVPGSGHDQLAVSGVASLGGTLEISFVDGYSWEADQEYVVLTAGTVTGTFDNVIAPGTFQVTYDADRVTISGSCPAGDTNGDCQVDLRDVEVISTPDEAGVDLGTSSVDVTGAERRFGGP